MYKYFKRFFDIFSSLIALVILLPLFIPVVFILSITSEKEIFYFQERLGLKNKPFMIFKFATMLKNSAKMKNGYMTIKNDPRLTFMGGFLRKSKINELPQLINIFKGDMSVVGPRPVMKISFDAYPEHVRKVIYNIKPGLTGIGSIIFRDEEDLITSEKNKGGDVEVFYREKIYPFKGSLELWYQKNQSFLVDLKIIIITAWVVLFPKSRLYHIWFKNLPVRDF